MEWHLIELPKLPEETDDTPLDKWTRFLKAERREEFEMIVHGNEYLQSAFDTLNVISQDEQKRLAYTARQIALYDKNEYAFENYERGKAEKESELIAKWKAKGMTDEQIKELLN
ncbi:MAG: Rpn family recombination-promoting nuclease/putative transposase, partial [Oscillospiraceae bacterium]|nr:Rpn family recombination-promoting nuclease/putative transposase [Oscillospiraceae bacterium]